MTWKAPLLVLQDGAMWAHSGVQADRMPCDQPFNQTEPVIVIPYHGKNLLLEGYLRSVLFIRNANPDLKILVWYPVPKGD
jgi:hypothetical protein